MIGMLSDWLREIFSGPVYVRLDSCQSDRASVL